MRAKCTLVKTDRRPIGEYPLLGVPPTIYMYFFSPEQRSLDAFKVESLTPNLYTVSCSYDFEG